MHIAVIPHGSEAYAQIKQLRQDVLRTPIGLVLNEKDVEGEDKQILIAAQAQGRVVGSVILKPISRTLMKLRQMAVADSQQGQGLGSQLVRFAEAHARTQGFEIMECHARVSAQPFYEKLGYNTTGDLFTEVGLPTIKMQKNL
ncbi:MAG: GNAT family N-acetyltransferase [Rickettsiales bacterium]|nr:GNAT family N-acetyltransferase [Rickettsiales bacterium]